MAISVPLGVNSSGTPVLCGIVEKTVRVVSCRIHIRLTRCIRRVTMVSFCAFYFYPAAPSVCTYLGTSDVKCNKVLADCNAVITDCNTVITNCEKVHL